MKTGSSVNLRALVVLGSCLASCLHLDSWWKALLREPCPRECRHLAAACHHLEAKRHSSVHLFALPRFVAKPTIAVNRFAGLLFAASPPAQHSIALSLFAFLAGLRTAQVVTLALRQRHCSAGRPIEHRDSARLQFAILIAAKLLAARRLVASRSIGHRSAANPGAARFRLLLWAAVLHSGPIAWLHHPLVAAVALAVQCPIAELSCPLPVTVAALMDRVLASPLLIVRCFVPIAMHQKKIAESPSHLQTGLAVEQVAAWVVVRVVELVVDWVENLKL